MLGEPHRTFYDGFYIVNPSVSHQYMIVDHRGWDSLLPKGLILAHDTSSSDALMF